MQKPADVEMSGEAEVCMLKDYDEKARNQHATGADAGSDEEQDDDPR